ncbi:MAG: SagB family peptide dehydrogenase, partial [Pseudonocardiaceae bacterium]
MTGGVRRNRLQVAADVRYRLSRFAYCRRQDNTLVLESPRSTFRTTIWGPLGAAVIVELAQPRAYPELARHVGDLPADAARELVTLLAHVELLTTVDDIGRSAEDLDPALRTWAFHDLLFHSRSRAGRHDYPMGGHYPFAGRGDAPPALKPPPAGRLIPLPTADLDRLEREDPPLTRALEQRRSIRAHGARPITTAQVGEFLYRVARVRRLHPPATVAGSTYESTDRPYPSAGAAYELELYLTVNRCADLAEGIYHYDPLGHRLGQVAQQGAHTEALLEQAKASCAAPGRPQLLITVTSRFERLSWKYCSVAYANTQKNVGVLFQTMY